MENLKARGITSARITPDVSYERHGSWIKRAKEYEYGIPKCIEGHLYHGLKFGMGYFDGHLLLPTQSDRGVEHTCLPVFRIKIYTSPSLPIPVHILDTTTSIYFDYTATTRYFSSPRRGSTSLNSPQNLHRPYHSSGNSCRCHQHRMCRVQSKRSGTRPKLR